MSTVASTPLAVSAGSGARGLRGSSAWPAPWWLASLLAPVAQAVSGLGGLGPGLVAIGLLGTVGLAHLGRGPRALQLRKELNLIGALPVVLLAAGAAALGLTGGALAGIGWACLAAGAFQAGRHSLGGELDAGTHLQWMLEPRPRWRLVLVKVEALVLVVVAPGAQVALGPADVGALGVAWGALVLGALLGLWAGRLRGGRVAMPFLLPAATSATLVGRSSWHLLRKELALQAGPIALGAAEVGAWFLWNVSRAFGWAPSRWLAPDSAAGVVWTLAMGAALLAGAGAFAEERALGTLTWQAMLASRSRIFRAKLLGSLLVTLVVSVGLPAVLFAVAPAGPVAPPVPAGRSGAIAAAGLSDAVTWVALVLPAWALGLWASTRSSRPVRAFLGGAGLHGLTLVVFVGALACSLPLAEWLQPAGPASCAAADGAGAARPWLGLAMRSMVLSPLGALVVGAVLGARSSWLKGTLGKPLGLVFGGFFVVALVAFAAAALLRTGC